LLTQRSTRDAELALILPVDGQINTGEVEPARSSIRALFPPDTLLIVPRGTHMKPELERTWTEAQHHIDLARRRGEDTPSRDELFESPEETLRALRSYGTIDLSGDEASLVFPFREPEEIQRDIKRLKQIAADGIPTLILCDNAGQAERLDELLNDDRVSPASLAIGSMFRCTASIRSSAIDRRPISPPTHRRRGSTPSAENGGLRSATRPERQSRR